MKNNKKFSNKQYTISGEKRAYVNFNGLKTLWFNTGTLCNLSCKDCYIESSPRNDRLLYLSHEDVCKYLNEIETSNINCKSIGITGGEPFMNKEIIKIISTCLNKGRELLILTNAMQPLQNKKCMLLNFQKNKNLKFRVSLDHYTKEKHEKIRGKNSWDKTINGITWLNNNNFNISVASRTLYEDEKLLRKGYKNLFEKLDLNLDACNNNDLVLFPNPTTAVNNIFENLKLVKGDEVLMTQHEYGALVRAWGNASKKYDFTIIKKEVSLPLKSKNEFLNQFLSAINNKTKVIFISQITSQTALIFPVAEICKHARKLGITTIVDGAHVLIF